MQPLAAPFPSCRHCIRPISCVSLRPSVLPGAICAPSQTKSRNLALPDIRPAAKLAAGLKDGAPMSAKESRDFIPVRIALMTVSDTRTRANDVSGDTLEARVRDAGHAVADRVVVIDDQAEIVSQLLKWIANPEIDVVISTGGTGLTGRDVTPEAFRSV